MNKNKKINKKISLFFIDSINECNGADQDDLIRHINLANNHGLKTKYLKIKKKNSKKIGLFLNQLYFTLKISLLIPISINRNRKKWLIFFTNSYPYTTILSLVLFKLLRIKTLIHIHRVPNKKGLANVLFLIKIKTADNLFTTETIIKHKLQTMTTKKISCYNFFIPNNTIIIKPTNKPFTISSLGAIREEKGVLDFLQLAQKVKNKDIYFNLIGKYSHKINEFDKILTKTQQVQPNLNFSNKFLSEKELNEEIKNSSFVCLPYDKNSYTFRGSGILYDLLKHNTPFLGTDIPIFNHYKNLGMGFIYQTLDELCDLILKLYIKKPKFNFEKIEKRIIQESYNYNYNKFIKEIG
ncbi:hypothetical protein DID75_00135 [Candidatus Marinamargulisbacteria bacterium SCGC AG-410-N11]|nr:hypothetical protein DID75_00135 [Candidatus Marinamargulisbacteria bacterium SCGC AG-410-N11]